MNLTIEVTPHEVAIKDRLGSGIVSRYYLPSPVYLLSEAEWESLREAERNLYRGEHNANAYTDVCEREQSEWLVPMWSQARSAAEMVLDPDTDTDADVRRETARRVARALAVLSYGADWLLR